MPTSPPATKRIRRCFFFSLTFIIVIPITCLVFGVTLHPTEFQYNASDNTSNGSIRKISLHADLVSANLDQGVIVLDWSFWDDTCDPRVMECANVNIYFDANLLQQSDTNSSKASDNGRPTDPIFIWNVTAAVFDPVLSNTPRFQTKLAVYAPFDYTNHSVMHTRAASLYYPFDRYLAEAFAFAIDARTNDTVQLFLESTSGLAVGLKISGHVFDTSSLAREGIPELIDVLITVQRGTLIIWYCIAITIIFWIITLTICLVMIMTVGFGFQQRNEIVVIPVGTVFAFTQLRSTMPGAPDGFGDILDFVGVLPCLVLLSICAVTMIGIYIFTDPAKESRENLTWPTFGELDLDEF
ncbi:uncharacterized protein EV420DRAFT_1559030 [Desarmillaria tabescens]|uniref:Uncharacterized protein n=1 Tax=Armillaria tabescens TaxID=1929756 RepID=A0AA39MZT3_ARMTA|nr:uncharacterized protein EV420DRAFT_1559030 [Desarmillaria tabescens]KAK0452134.1 hypothetical protein EV420DRAFT_1559030 [Desarmillaria tabescens]